MSSKQPVDQPTELLALGHGVVIRDEVLGVGDRQDGRVVLEGMPVEGQRVQDAAEHPDVALLADGVALLEVQLDVSHLGRPVEHGHGLVDVLLDVHERRPWEFLWRHDLGAARTKIAELPRPTALHTPQDVLHLQVPVLDGRTLGVEMADPIDNLHERLHHVARREVAVLAVHEVEEVPTAAQLHQHLHSAHTSRMLRGGIAEALHDVRVWGQASKDLRLLKSGLVAAGHLHPLLADDLL
mmetsp:Transcript_78425/g.229946  ORF Transcript_78425/g.229946 Transcript_78425/m.229946 type:complete len:240 (+) Transcript_78425:1217-1936(+)